MTVKSTSINPTAAPERAYFDSIRMSLTEKSVHEIEAPGYKESLTDSSDELSVELVSFDEKEDTNLKETLCVE